MMTCGSEDHSICQSEHFNLSLSNLDVLPHVQFMLIAVHCCDLCAAPLDGGAKGKCPSCAKSTDIKVLVK